MAGAGDDIHYCHLQCLQQYCRHAYAPAQVAVAVVLAVVCPVLVILNFQFKMVKKYMIFISLIMQKLQRFEIGNVRAWAQSKCCLPGLVYGFAHFEKKTKILSWLSVAIDLLVFLRSLNAT